MTNKFKVGDSVRRKSPRAKAAKIVGEYGKGWYDISYPSTDKRYKVHQRFLELIVKPESKDRSELYKLLPRVSEWELWAMWCAIDKTFRAYFYDIKPRTLNNVWSFDDRTFEFSHITLPPSISWKDTLVSREEMEAWEKSELDRKITDDFCGLTEDELNMPVRDYYMTKLNDSVVDQVVIKNDSGKTTPTVIDQMIYNTDESYCNQTEPIETPQAKVERLKAELKEAEQELDRVTPIELYDGAISPFIFTGKDVAPEGLRGKCLMFNSNSYRVEQSTHNQYTVLTFFKK